MMSRDEILESLCIGDVLEYPSMEAGSKPVYYVIRKMHHQPQQDPVRGLITVVIGFTLLHTAKLEDREVTADEMVKEFTQNSLQQYAPPLTRRARWETIKAPPYEVVIQHKTFVIRPGEPVDKQPYANPGVTNAPYRSKSGRTGRAA